MEILMVASLVARVPDELGVRLRSSLSGAVMASTVSMTALTVTSSAWTKLLS